MIHLQKRTGQYTTVIDIGGVLIRFSDIFDLLYGRIFHLWLQTSSGQIAEVIRRADHEEKFQIFT
jgi:hypothetical protein